MQRIFFVIQGPPGTGKSTGISEIIWQHLRQNGKQRILVTSETNLAVDNALDRLRSRFHNLIKPVRFGNEEKLDNEGKRFSIQLLAQWADSAGAEELLVEDQEIEENTVHNSIEEWINRISRYSGAVNLNPLNEELIERWKNVLELPNTGMKKMFYDEYINYTNVIGATCSSIGKTSSTGNYTTFFFDYCNIYNKKAVSNFKAGLLLKDKFLIKTGAQALEKEEIKFDLVIQDEASKASPPEMALPMVYSKKSILIGDHKQLPPMVDTNEFIQDIKNVAIKSRDKNLINRSKVLIEYIKENRDSFSASHFETMYSNIHVSLKSAFNTQYRMHPAINNAISQFYPINYEKGENGLHCGLDINFVDDPNKANPQSRYHGLEIPGFITSNKHIIWIDVKSPEFKYETSRFNLGEIEVIQKVIKKLDSSLSFHQYQQHWKLEDEKQIGIISFYGAQLQKLRKLEMEFPNIPMRISTVDRFQGMERNILIVSTVRSNKLALYDNQDPLLFEDQESLGFAEFPNRLNVALSRAKRLLIIVGNAEHFSREEIYSNVIKGIKESPAGLFLNETELED